MRAAHLDRVDRLVGDYLAERARGATHPVLDFLFTYYSFKPGHLRRWNPGYGVVLAGDAARDYAGFASYERHVGPDGGMRVRESVLDSRRSAVEFTLGLLRATAARPPHHGCFGLHEWAMVYRGGHEALRHGSVPLRLGHDGTDAVVESMTIRCTHYDAFRFFTDDAVPRNLLQLAPSSRVETEQPGCVHASMDLYKWSYKLAPLIDSDLVTDCFELALAARTVDMRASPYDLSDYGLAPIAIETPGGRSEYVRAQAALTARATPLRHALITRCENLLVSGGDPARPTAE
ncbi:3-methyladenine DNA glycosylase [Rhodococcus sp. BP-252]|uniref:3-methyladenine DNA glycosylase n=1 Tax=unclassified Rhodococcus (in: high G+C Gram-positive bacteria) TaxID=192944 RepID=UPI001C9BADA7|nr:MULTISPECIES: 3-methyladenine DNA glycosylase [unclassified Rhodococcus (in: high G+C Gram-positive bacteria)]MBY6410152.1 3-methyladenine DNA glycosylase [Rhodococcus sp. BP-320]MBY6415121.1 3-methyladenine DNA glycosylase [Rhodococcus sp. BP-321]MBY6421444.1 3-methyladenine DNA glycosylase [Rhodococcus sp. BP-324]MBY6425571.1 3-methyladenine DNA glycosylase [Rhodococcus sp. BP-323]MBY6430017.1 3-methyladenine DNA glycosylase [Rhodococcus sp. BP-322]